MHEGSIVQALLAQVQEHVPPGRHVRSVQVRVGRLSGVSPDSLRFFFEILRGETLGEQAQLEVRLEPLRARCVDCAARATLEEASWSCPACGAPGLVFENGDELDLLSLVVEDGEPDNDRAQDPQEERRGGRGEPAAD